MSEPPADALTDETLPRRRGRPPGARAAGVDPLEQNPTAPPAASPPPKGRGRPVGAQAVAVDPLGPNSLVPSVPSPPPSLDSPAKKTRKTSRSLSSGSRTTRARSGGTIRPIPTAARTRAPSESNLTLRFSTSRPVGNHSEPALSTIRTPPPYQITSLFLCYVSGGPPRRAWTGRPHRPPGRR